MKQIGFAIIALWLAGVASASEVYINEVLPNTPGSDTGNEYFELRGTPNLPLTGYYLISVEGQGTGTPGKGDINQFFDLSAFSLGANGYLFARQAGSKYTPTAPGATVIENTLGTGWGQANAGGVGSTVGHYSDGTQVDLENSATTILLVKVAPGGVTPTNTIDLDTDNDGYLDLPDGWTVVDSVGIMDGANAAATDSLYGAINFRAPDTNGNYVGTCVYGNIINVPGPLTTSAGTFYVGRKGESTGSTAYDWVGAIIDGKASAPRDFIFHSASDPAYNGLKIADMAYGGPNLAPPVEPLPPAPPVLIGPASDAMDIATTAVLQASVSDPGGSNLTVTFYGGPVATGPDFTLVALPDTQYYSAQARRGLPAMFTAQTDWIVANRLAWNIAYVAHLGDIVDTGDVLSQWRNATNALYRLEDPLTTGLPEGIPYGVAVGNHDQAPNGDPSGDSTAYFNQFFGVDHFAGKAYYGGHYGDNNDNHFDLFSAGGMDFIVVYFEYDTKANAAVLSWAKALLQTHAHRRAIVVSHYIGRASTPSSLGSQGSAIYKALRSQPNLFLMLSGHVNGEGSRTDVYAGNTVHTLVADYQFRPGGGDGFLRLLRFSPAFNRVRVFTYSPWLREYETDADSQFEFAYDMQAAATAFTPLATNQVASGSLVNYTWPDLSPGAAYDWYVTVSNGRESVASPIWRFATAPENPPWTNLAPILNEFAHHTMPANTTTEIPFTIDDPETDPTNLVVTASSSNDALLPPAGISIGGTGADRVLQLTPAPDQAGAAWFTVAVSDGDYTPSKSFMLKVLQPEILALWDFNSNPPDNNSSTGTLIPAMGAGVAASVGTATNSLNSDVASRSFDPRQSDNSKWRLTSFPAQGTSNRTSGAEFRVSTVGYRNIGVSWDHYNSAAASRYWRVQYTVDGIHFNNTAFVYTNPHETLWLPTGLSLAGLPGVDNNPNFGLRIVSEWESTATGHGADQYRGTQASGGYSPTGTLWLDMVTISGEILPPQLALDRVENRLLLSWPTNQWSFTLQSRTSLSAGHWEVVPTPPLVTNGYNLVVTTNTASTRFFRLAR